MFSVLNTFASSVKVLQEGAFVCVFNILVVAKAFISSYGSFPNRCELVQDNATPNVAILYAVEAIGAACNKLVDNPWVALLVVLAPVASKLQLCLFRGVVLAEAHEVDKEWHVAAVAAEKAKALKVSLHE